MKQVGEVGCLVDSLIDLNADRRLGLLMLRLQDGSFEAGRCHRSKD